MGILSNTWKHIRRSPYQASAAVLTMFLTFLLSGIFFLASAASFFILQYFESKPQLTVFLKDKAAQQEAQVLQNTLQETGKTVSITYVSKEEALTIYREQNKDDPLLLEMVTSDILPASLEVSASDPKYLTDLAGVISSSPHVEEVVYQKDVVESLLTWTNAIRFIGGALATLLAINSLLIIMTVISMKIALKRDEVEILKLVGASPSYIRMPFVLEGGVYGVLGSWLAWVVITSGILWFQQELLSFLGAIPAIQLLLLDPSTPLFITSSLGFLAVLISLGFFLGSLGSVVAVGRYLKF